MADEGKPLGGGYENAIQGYNHRFQDTGVAFDVPSDDPHLQKLFLDTEPLDDPDCVGDKDGALDTMSGYDGDVVLDSEDEEGIGAAKLVRVATGFSPPAAAAAADDDDDDEKGWIHHSVTESKRLQFDSFSGVAQGYLPDRGNSNVGKDDPQLVSCDQGFARLNYTVSQEPGQSSQDKALEIVDHLLSVNVVSDSPQTMPMDSIRKRVSPVSSSKGAQSLAKIINTRTSSVVKNGPFEWVDYDQHGGDDLLRTIKDECSKVEGHGQRSVARHHKAGHIDSQKGRSSGSNSNKESQTGNLHEKAIGSSHLDSSLTVHPPNEQLCGFPSGEKLATCGTENDTAEVFDVGFDTQMAAEAIETLSYALPPRHIDDDLGPQKSMADSSRGKTKSRIQLKEPYLQKNVSSNLDGTEGPPKQRKRSTMKGTSRSSWKESSNNELDDQFATTTKRKRCKPMSGGLSCRKSTHIGQGSSRKSKKPAEQMWEGEVKGKSNIQQLQNYGSSAVPCENMSLGQHLQDKAAQETGHRTAAGKLNLRSTEDESPNLGERKSYIMQDNIVTYRRKRSSLVAKDGTDNNEARRNYIIQDSIITYKRKRSRSVAGPSKVFSCRGEYTDINKRIEQNPATMKVSSLTDSLKLDAWTYPKRKRTSQRLGRHSNRASNQYTPAVDQKVHKKPLDKNPLKSSLLKELIRLGTPEWKPDLAQKDLKKQRDMAHVRVLFSQHLDDNIIKHQTKILARLGISIASCMLDATHFIADKFVRTRNMLEAIAHGKPVVTHLWLESCAEGRCLMDEEDFILRDTLKEKEIGFSLPVSLARANQHPLLKGRRVFITPKVKPGKEIVMSLVKAARGQVLVKNQILVLKAPDDLLIISCEEDYAICVPFLDKGISVFSSELLFNGIIVQKLEYDRHKLFMNHIQKSRSCKR